MKLTYVCLSFKYFVWLMPVILAESTEQFLGRRKQLFQEEEKSFFGSKLTLSEDELKVNTKLMRLKSEEFDKCMKDNDIFPPSEHFFLSRQSIEKSSIFEIIRNVPKGAALHLHDSSLVAVQWLVMEATYMFREYLYYCVDDKAQLYFIYSAKPPTTAYSGMKPNGCRWELVEIARNRYGAHTVDEWFLANLTLVVDNPWTAYPSQKAVWQRFYSLFTAADGLVFFAGVFPLYFIEALEEFYVDRVQYMEFRALLPEVYELDGSKHNETWLMNTYINISAQFSKKYPDFVGANVIYSTSRIKTNISENLEIAIELRRQFPEHMLGFDLVGREDPGQTLLYHLDTLLLPSQKGVNLPYFFHAGETDWEGVGVDDNLIDALLLNTTRIGHGFAIAKHPLAMQVAKQRGVAIEVCPISNQVLRLVSDLRNHPLAALFAADSVPVVVSSDDPGLWLVQGLSYDWYEAFMGLGGAKADLRFLKQLALNSIKYSALSSTEKGHFLSVWQKQWDLFIKETLAKYRL